MKGLSKGRYDETFAGEDAQYRGSAVCWNSPPSELLVNSRHCPYLRK